MTMKKKGKDMPNDFNRKYLKSLENLLQSRKASNVLSNIIDDFSGERKWIRWRTIFRNGVFIISHPITTWNIYNLFQNHQDYFTSAAFQRELLQKKAFWDMLKKFSDNKLPQISEAIYNLTNISYFKKGNILDPQSLEQLKNIFNNAEDLEKLQDIAITYLNQNNQNIVGLNTLQKLLNFTDQSEEFKKFYQNNKSKMSNTVNDIMIDLMKQQPVIKYYLGDVQLGDIVANIVNDTSKLKSLVKSVSELNEKKMNPVAAVSFCMSLTQIAYNRKQDLLNMALTRLQGEGYDARKALTNHIFENFQDVSDNNLSDVAKSVMEDQAMLDEVKTYQQFENQDLDKAKTLLSDKMLFAGINIEGVSQSHPKNLENAEISDENFIGTNFTNINLQNAKITNSQFYGAKFSNINLKGAQIDGGTLATMLPGIKRGKISLKDVKIIGSIPEFAELEGVSFKGADLSELQSFGGANLAKASSLQYANFGNNQHVLLTGDNNDKLIHLTQFSKGEVEVLQNISAQVARNLFQDGVEGNRKEDAQIISDIIIDAASNLKEMLQDDLSTVLKENQKKLVGNLSTGALSTTGIGLSKIFYDSTKYTKMGYLSGGIALNTETTTIDKLSARVTNFLLQHVQSKSYTQSLQR